MGKEERRTAEQLRQAAVALAYVPAGHVLEVYAQLLAPVVLYAPAEQVAQVLELLAPAVPLNVP